jgi:DNA-binding transcriptional LysR family regulator
VIVEFLKSYPDIHIRFLQSDRFVNLVDEHVDVAARIGHLPDSSLIATRVGMIRLVCCASPDYLAEHGAPSTPADLLQHPCISFDPIARGDQWVFKGEVSAGVSSRLKASAAEAAVQAAIGGLGIARVASYQVDDAVAAGRLRLLLEDFEPAAIPVSLVYPDQARQVPLKLRAFLDFAVPRLRARLDSSSQQA